MLPTHSVIPHPPVDYRQVFRPILYFQPSPAQRRVIRDLPPPPFFTVSATDLRERFLISGFFYLALLTPRKAEDFPRSDKYFKDVRISAYIPNLLITNKLYR